MILSLFSFLDRKPVEIYDNSATLRLGLLGNWRRQQFWIDWQHRTADGEAAHGRPVGLPAGVHDMVA